MPRQAPGIRGRGRLWRITVCSADNTRLIFHAVSEDEEEIQALATEARGHSPALKIWIKPPMGAKLRSWD